MARENTLDTPPAAYDRPAQSLQGGRAAYRKQILVTVSRELTAEYGRGFSYAEIARMIQCSQLFPDEAIVVTLRTRQHQAIEHAHEQAARRAPEAKGKQ